MTCLQTVLIRSPPRMCWLVVGLLAVGVVFLIPIVVSGVGLFSGFSKALRVQRGGGVVHVLDGQEISPKASLGAAAYAGVPRFQFVQLGRRHRSVGHAGGERATCSARALAEDGGGLEGHNPQVGACAQLSRLRSFCVCVKEARMRTRIRMRVRLCENVPKRVDV